MEAKAHAQENAAVVNEVGGSVVDVVVVVFA
jgi:hypothetical protein